MRNYQPLVLGGHEPRDPSQTNPVRDAVRGGGIRALSLSDPLILEFMRDGMEAMSGARVTVQTALRNPAMFRAVSLISYAVGMLPLRVIDKETKEKADHPLYRVLHREPNNWQTAFDFRTLMQLRALVYGNAYAIIVRSRQIRTGKLEVVRLVPIHPDQVTPVQAEDWSVSYRYQPPKGAMRILAPEDVFHLRGISLDGINGLSVVKQARDALGNAMAAEIAAGRLFKNGVMAGGLFTHPGKLSDPAFARLKGSLSENAGAENAGESLILEEGMKWEVPEGSARDAQLIELSRFGVEQIARGTGVPRPLLMMDDTSWGTGLSALVQFFHQFGLSPWFSAWEQAGERSLLVGEEKDRLEIKFNAGGFLRGSPKEQAEVFARALGSGGSPGWLSQNEVRAMDDRSPVANGDEINKGSGAAKAAKSEGGGDAQT